MTEAHTQIPTDAVIVGLDGSERDATCLAWAAGAATRARKPLHLIHARETAAELGASDPAAVRGVAAAILYADDSVLEDAIASATEQWPDLTTTGSEPWGNPERVLVEASEGAHLVVVGSRRLSGLQRLLLGRSALAVAMHAKCPVVLLPDGARTDAEGPVVVGVDGSEHAQRAADRAFWIAGVRGTSVRVVICWYLEVVDGSVVTTPENPAWAQVEDKYRTIAENLLKPVRGRYPDVPYEIAVRRGDAPQILTEESSAASLLVMGSRGRGGFRGMLLGSVTHKVIETAACPVMVIRQA